MRILFSFLCVLALGVMGCSETTGAGGSGGIGGDGGGIAGNGGGTAECPVAGNWINTSISCDEVAQAVPNIEYNFAEDCTGHAALCYSETCCGDIRLTFTPENGGSTIVDTGAITCDVLCAKDECQEAADGGLPFSAALIVTDDTWTLTAVTTEQMVSDEIAACEAGQTMVSVAARVSCAGLEDGTDCAFGVCFNESCHAFDCSEQLDGVNCYVPDPVEPTDRGLCLDGTCEPAVERCTEQQDGTPCFSGPEIGTCEAGVCELG